MNGKNIAGSASLAARMVVAAVLAIGASAQACAQADARTGSNPAAPAELAEIVVTATKRAVPLQEVPLSITAVTNEQLQQLGADQFEDYARTIPSLSFVDNGPSKNKVVIRGVTAGIGPDSNDTTGVYFDDIPVGASGRTPDLRLVDVERVEVLRGPQGTLYGSGSMGGTLRVILRKADATVFHADGEATFSSTEHGGNNAAASGTVNVPFVRDKLALRAVGYYRNFDGFIDNVTLGANNVNTEHTQGGRLSIAWSATENADFTLNLFNQSSRYEGRNDFSPAAGDLKQTQSILEPLKDDFTVYNLVAHVNLGWATLDSSSSYFRRQVNERRDVSAQIGAPGYLDDHYGDRRVAEEVRLTSRDTGRFEWIVGAFYDDVKSGSPQFAQAQFQPGVDSVLFDAPIAVAHDRQFATFGEVSYDLTDKLQLTAGLRGFRFEQSQHFYTRGGTVFAAQEQDQDIRGSSSKSGVTPKLLLSYKPAPNRLLYASAAQGFRQGGPTGLGVPGANVPRSYDPDSLWNYELGAKTQWLGGRLTLNGAVFYIDWSHMQTTFADPSGFQYVINTGSATIKGAEIELRWRPIEQLELSLTGSRLEPKLNQNQPPPNDGLSGQRIPGVPQGSLSASSRYTFPLRAAFAGFIQADYQYVGDTMTGFKTAFGRPDVTADRQPAYGLGNVRLGVESDRYEVALFVDNLWDERPVLFLDRSFYDTRVHTSRPRTYGLTLRAQL